ADGTQLLHTFGYYTMNAIPGGAVAGAGQETVEQGEDSGSAKRVTAMPAAWNGKVDADLLIESALGMKFKQATLRVKAGQRVRLTFRNPDDMQHNFVLTAGKKAKAVGEAALELGLRGLGMDYVPETDNVLAHTRLVEPETEDVIYFTAPKKPGLYEYVCTVPGHWTVMRGALLVE
ncbi:MAG: plastocyanin/azurin family copper-binding protein, partial [Bacteroidota bacterium]